MQIIGERAIKTKIEKSKILKSTSEIRYNSRIECSLSVIGSIKEMTNPKIKMPKEHALRIMLMNRKQQLYF